jgi:hypothetical protein
MLRSLWLALVLGTLFAAQLSLTAAEKTLRAGAFAIDITPLELPVIVNGGMTERTADKVHDRLHARCLVLDDGSGPLAMVVVDSCMLPRQLLDDAKKMAQALTNIPPERILISATHTHSAPAAMGCLGSDADPKYVAFLPGQLAKGIKQAHDRLAPARIGFGMGIDEKNVACRRWKMKPGIAPTNPYSDKRDDQAMMHPGYDNPNKIEATGPVDPGVAVVVVQTLAGEPLAWLSAYSLHYVGMPALSADYFALFNEQIAGRFANQKSPHPFVAMLANGTSGDAWLMDYSLPSRRTFSPEQVAKEVAEAAYAVYPKLEFFRWAPIVMEERTLELGVRMPSADEVAKAKEFVATFADRKTKTVPEVYAREILLLNEMPPTRELKMQAIRIGDLGIATIPNEVFGATGLAIKKESPLKTTFTIELANGAEGYIPPPEMHALGGYETWRARTSCLEVQAEPKIRAAAIALLKSVAGKRTEEVPVKVE